MNVRSVIRMWVSVAAAAAAVTAGATWCVSAAFSAEAQAAPGQFLRHYAPRARLTLYLGEPSAVVARIGSEARQLAAGGTRVGVLGPEEDVMALAPVLAASSAAGRVISRAFGSRRDPARAAQELFDALRAIDAENPDVILASTIPPEGIGLAVRDRLTRAAEGRVVYV